MADVVKLDAIRQRVFLGKDERPAAVNDIAESITRDRDVGDAVEIHADMLRLVIRSARCDVLKCVSRNYDVLRPVILYKCEPSALKNQARHGHIRDILAPSHSI